MPAGLTDNENHSASNPSPHASSFFPVIRTPVDCLGLQFQLREQGSPGLPLIPKSCEPPVRKSSQGRHCALTCKIRTDLPQDGLLGMERHLLPAVSRLYSQDALIVTDADANVLYWSRSATRIFGYSAEEMVGNPLSRAIPVELQAEEEEAVNGLVPGALK